MVTVEHTQSAAIPSAAEQGRELRLTAAHGVQHGGELLGEHQETAIACLLAPENADEAARGETRAGDTILRPGGIHFGEELGDLVPTRSLARLAGFSDQHDKQIQGVTGGPDHTVRSRTDDVAKGGEELQENGFRLGLGVRGQGAHGLPGEAIERVLVEYVSQGWPGGGGRLLTHSTWLRAGSGLWLGLGFRRERSRVAGEIAEAGFVWFRLCGWVTARKVRRGPVRKSRAGFALRMKAGQGEQLAPSAFYVCEGGQLRLS